MLYVALGRARDQAPIQTGDRFTVQNLIIFRTKLAAARNSIGHQKRTIASHRVLAGKQMQPILFLFQSENFQCLKVLV